MGARPKPAKRGALRLLPVCFLDRARAGKGHPLREASLVARVAALACAGFLGAPMPTFAASAPPMAGAQGTTRLAGTVAPMVTDGPEVGAVPGAETETIEVWMAGRLEAAQRYVNAVSTPGSPSYLRFLTPDGYTKRFGPSAAQLRAVESYLTEAGFTRVQASRDDDYISATAPVSTVNRAFSLQVRRYKATVSMGKATAVEPNDRDLAVPAAIKSDVLAVTGLGTVQPQADDLTAGTAAGAKVCSRYWGQKTTVVSPPFDGTTEAAVPVCGYSAKQLRAAYGLTSADTGVRETIAIVEVGAPNKMLQTLSDYARANGLPAPLPAQYREEAVGPGGQGCLDTALQEAALDSEAAYAMAPRARQLMVDGSSCEAAKDYPQALLDAMLAPLTGKTGPSAAVELVTYDFGYPTESSVPKSVLKASHAIALRAAAEGVSLLVSSGDSPGVSSPSSDPDVTAVGGTTLGIGAYNQRLFETSTFAVFGQRTGKSGPWVGGTAVQGTGGGVSSIYAEPRYQKGVVPSAMSRNRYGHAGRAVPDISADGNVYSGMLVGYIPGSSRGKAAPYETFVDGGTSLATPLVAGMVADGEQGRRARLGFLNPLLYSVGPNAGVLRRPATEPVRFTGRPCRLHARRDPVQVPS